MDVGRRIGRKIRQNEDTQAAASLDEQMYKIQIRGDGDKHIAQVYEKLEEAKYKKSLDRIPCVPGQWTVELHSAVMQDLEEAAVLALKGHELYQSVRATDKIEVARKAQEDVEEAKYHSLRTKAAQELLKESEKSLQDATNLGWPWGREIFEKAEAMVEQARDELSLVGETGTDDDTLRPKPQEFHLKRQQWRVHTARRECQLLRAAVQIELERLHSQDSTVRARALGSLSEFGRIPVPGKVNFFGHFEALEKEDTWRAGSGRGDVEVVEAIIAKSDDSEWVVRKAVTEALPRAATTEDPRVVQVTLRLVEDVVPFVRAVAMETVVQNSERGDRSVIAALVRRLHDTDESVRRLAVRLLPLSIQQPEDTYAVDEVLATVTMNLDEGGGGKMPTLQEQTPAHDHWITRESDCLVASLQALTGITPRGHEAVTRVALHMLKVSREKVIADFTSPARDANDPLKGASSDFGESRGPVSLQRQLEAIVSRPPSSCLAKRGLTSDRVRTEAIALLRAVAVRAVDIARERERIREAEAAGAEQRQIQRMRARGYGGLLRHVLVVEGLSASFLDFHRDVRWMAAHAVAEIAERNDQAVVEGIVVCLQNMDVGVRELAVGMLSGDTTGRVMDPGCSLMTDALCGLLTAEVRETRETAAHAVRVHCERGDTSALYFLLQLLADERGHVREIALQLLVELSPPGEKRVLRELDACTRGVDASVRIMAMYALVKISKHGDASTKHVIEDLLFDADESVRCAATYAMAQVCKRGDHLAVERLLGNCQDMAESVRRASVDALTRVSSKGNVAVIETALRLINDPSDVVRRQAYDTLAKLTEKGDDVVCSRIIARLGVEKSHAIDALAALRQLPWSPEKSVSFSRGTTAHSSSFWWSAADGVTQTQRFRMPGGVPVTDASYLRASTSGMPHSSSMATPHAPKTPVLDVPFQLRPNTANSEEIRANTASAILFRMDSSRPTRAVPGSVLPRASSPKSRMSAATFAPHLLVDTDAGFDHMFALLLLYRAALVPELITTIHGMAEAVSGAVVIKRLFTTIGHGSVRVVPSCESTVAKQLLRFAQPGSLSPPSRGLASRGAKTGALLRPDGGTRRISSRWGPDYRRQLSLLADHLSLAPLGISHGELLRAPGLHLRLAALQYDLRRLSTEADVHTGELNTELARVRGMLEQLTTGRSLSFSEDFDPLGGAEPSHVRDNVQDNVQGHKGHVQDNVQGHVGGERGSHEGHEAQVLRVESPMGPAEALRSPVSNRRIAFADESGEQGGGRRARTEQEEEEEWDAKCFHSNSAVSALLSQLMSRGVSESTILCLGSLTNLDQALRHDPHLVKERLKNVVIMGGAVRVVPSAVGDHAFYKHGEEFNCYYDPKALKNILHSGLDVTMIGLEVANATVATPALLDTLAHAEATSVSAWILQQLVLMFDLAPGYAAVAAFYVIRPEAFKTEQVWIVVDVASGRTEEVDPGTESSVPVRMATWMDHGSYAEFLQQIFND